MRLKPRTLSVLKDGKIIPPMNLEVIVADHCNIACRQCNHASPIMKKWNATVEETEQMLDLLSGVYHCKRLRLIGGEPLLNPKIVEIIQIAKQSGIADLIQLTTNGMLLDRLPDAGWQALDEVELSLYEISNLSADKIDALKRKGTQFGTRVNVSKYENFRMTFTAQKAKSAALVEDIWSACKMANVWGCHALRKDRLYRCPQSIYVPGFTGGQLEAEGFALSDRSGLRDDLLNYLNAAGPLKACANCVGSCGKQFEQTGLERKSWKDDLNTPFEDMIDYELLERSKVEIQEIDDCRKPIKRTGKSRGFLKRKLKQLISSE
jgi:organic radical activating enzyme